MINYEITRFKKEDKDNILSLWNEEVGFIFPIDDCLFRQCTLDSIYFDYDSSYCAYDGDKLVGFILGKVYDNNKVIEKYCNTGWITLFFVKRSYRKNGIGSKLLSLCEESMKEKNICKLQFGSDIDNFFPGIPQDFDNLSDKFFRNRGYNVTSYTHDMVKKTKKDDIIKFDSYHNHEYTNENGEIKKVEIRYAKKEDRQIVLDFFIKAFYGRWYLEALNYFNDDDIKKEYLIAIVDGIVVGFLRVNNQLIKKLSYNINWRNRFEKLSGFGPLGVLESYRKNGIAKMLLYYAIKDCTINGYTDLLIDWTGLVSYYEQFGFEVFKCYWFCYKSL